MDKQQRKQIRDYAVYLLNMLEDGGIFDPTLTPMLRQLIHNGQIDYVLSKEDSFKDYSRFIKQKAAIIEGNGFQVISFDVFTRKDKIGNFLKIEADEAKY
jgi:hypothetical protein